MPTPPALSAPPPPSWKRANFKPFGMTAMSVPDMLAHLHVDPEIGLTHAEVDSRRKEHGYNEVAEKKAHPIRAFLEQF